MTRPLVIAVATALAAVSGVSQAYDVTDWFRVEGFGTIGGFRADDPVAGVRADTKVRAVSRSETRFDGDSQLSVQGTINPTGPIKAVVQLLGKQDIQGNSRPKTEWAYVGWDVNSDWNLKVGRTVAPIFLMSDYRNLYFSQTMARNPATYFLNPITFQDGLSASWSHTLPIGDVQLDAYDGKTDFAVAQGKVKVSNIWGLTAKWSKDAFTLRAHHDDFKLDFDAPTFDAALKTFTTAPFSIFCTNCQAVLGADFSLKGVKGKIDTVAAAYDDSDWLAQAEYGVRTSNSVATAKRTSTWYAMGGKRIGDFTPFVSYGTWKVDAPPVKLIAAPGSPAKIAATVAYLNGSNYSTGDGSRDIWSVGTRWDFAKGTALKLQYDMIKMKAPAAGSAGAIEYPTSLLGKPNGFDGKVNVYTVNVDFVF